MAVPITPNTSVYLLKCPLEMDNQNQLNFANATAQFNYFNSLPKLEFDNFTYQRHEGVLRINEHVDNLLGYNYVMYQNDNYSDKWFYAFIENMEYVNDNCTFVKLRTDVFQTWFMDTTIKQSLVVREHVNDDTIGLHTIPETIEYGEYIINNVTNTTYQSAGTYLVAIQVTQVPDDVYSQISSLKRVYNGLPQGCFVLCIPVENYHDLNQFIRSYDELNLAEAIISMSVIPQYMAIGESQTVTHTGTNYSFSAIVYPPSYDALNLQNNFTININQTLDGYQPVNNKLYCAPYNYLTVSNNSGSDVCYAWEDFDHHTANFDIYGAWSQGCDIKLVPDGYKRATGLSGYNWSLSASKYPMISWNSDYYLNWVAVNGKYMEVKASLTAIEWVGNVIGSLVGMSNADARADQTGAPSTGGINATGLVTSLAGSAANMQQQVREAQMVPDSAKGNQNTGDLNFSLHKDGFTAYSMSIKAEYAREIDAFFSKYGYKVNMNKVPNITGRQNWNYVETLNINIQGDIPQGDMQELKNIFNRGVTIWHNPSTYLDYTQPNNII